LSGREGRLEVGAQEEALLGDCRSGVTGGSHAGIKVLGLPPRGRPTSQSPRGLRDQCSGILQLLVPRRILWKCNKLLW